MKSSTMPPSVNFHFWQPCNMKCDFCFARFLDVRKKLGQGHLPEDECAAVVELLAARFEKITFVGGEPTQCSWLPRLLAIAKAGGCTTVVVTNGSRLESLLDASAGDIDWVALSVDSAMAATHLATGRAVGGTRPLGRTQYIALADRVRRHGIRLKINTVVTSKNIDEDISTYIGRLGPERWKVFQVLPVDGQNQEDIALLRVCREQFLRFVEEHRVRIPRSITLAAETNEDMRGSYAMVDPAGRFFDNTAGGHTYSKPILKVGLQAAWSEIAFHYDRFENRGGLYPWGRED